MEAYNIVIDVAEPRVVESVRVDKSELLLSRRCASTLAVISLEQRLHRGVLKGLRTDLFTENPNLGKEGVAIGGQDLAEGRRSFREPIQEEFENVHIILWQQDAVVVGLFESPVESCAEEDRLLAQDLPVKAPGAVVRRFANSDFYPISCCQRTNLLARDYEAYNLSGA